MTEKLMIGFDGKQFVIKCPFHANDLIRDMPARKWSRQYSAWICQPIAGNVAYINQKLRPFSNILPEANKQLIELENRRAALKATKGVGFPHWFQFKTQPRAHQKRCLDKFYGLPVMAMHMDRGTGKTKTTIDMAAALRTEGKIDSVLIVCKIALRRNWADEFGKHCPIPADVFLPSTKNTQLFSRWLQKSHDFKVMVVGTESLSAGRMHELADSFLTSKVSPFMVIDESHDISNHKAIRSQKCVELGKKAKYRATLTGTPMSKGMMDLFMQYEFLDPEVIGLGDFYSFKNRYAVMGGYRDAKGKPMQIVGYQNVDELMTLIAPYTFSVEKKDVLDLPPKVYKRYYVELTEEQKKAYITVAKENVIRRGDDEHNIRNALEKALRLHQIAGGHTVSVRVEEREMKDGELRVERHFDPVDVIPYTKNPKILQMLNILEEDEKQTVIWATYKAEIRDICAALGADGVSYDVLRAGEEEQNWNRIQQFQAGAIRVLVSSTAIGGTGFNMTAAEQMIYYNNTHHMVDRLQSEDRAHRDGLKHSVLYIDLIAEKTIDEAIIKSNELKMDLLDYIKQRVGEIDRVFEGG